MFRLPTSPTRFSYPVLILVSALSFWSSGVMLIRFLGSVGVWSHGGVGLGLVYALSVPLIFISISGVHNLFTRLTRGHTTAVFQITGLVLMMHALVTTLVPTLYRFTSTSGLYATAWLLWFGGVTILLQSFAKKSTPAYVQQ